MADKSENVRNFEVWRDFSTLKTLYVNALVTIWRRQTSEKERKLPWYCTKFNNFSLCSKNNFSYYVC